MAHDKYQRPWVFMRFYEGHRTRKRKLNAAERAEYRAWIERLWQGALKARDALVARGYGDIVALRGFEQATDDTGEP